ncbi:purine permease [Mycena rebaudengoi]|nr:purine permease [Mycena rebaudengoi]
MASSTTSIRDSQPGATSAPVPVTGATCTKHIKHKVSTQEGWLGNYDYAWLCMPSWPFSKTSHEPPFYALDVELPLVLAIANGLQHALAMLAGLITPPIIFASALNLDSETSSYMISASLNGCGILSLVQMSRIPLFGGYYLGTGLISVVGTSFSTLSTANGIFDAMYRDGTCSSTVGADGTITRNACPDAYGKVLGTSLICSFLEIFMAFIPARVLKRTFPPLVTGTVVLLIGASLIGDSGALNWGGGANSCQTFSTNGIFQLCPTIFAPRPLPWASPEFIGLGFLSFIRFVSALFTVTPLSIFAQNNGVIAITRCANRAAGRWCCVFLILFGVLGKISGALLAIPNSVLGGVTTFLFASVAVSGLRVLSYNKYTRRDRFVLAAALSFGVGDLLGPGLFTHLFDEVNNPNNALQGFFNSITIILSTPSTFYMSLP